MARLSLRLLLILSLVLNGVAAPWAMARMPHADGDAGHAHAEAATGEAHAGHAAHAGHVLPAEQPPAVDEGVCCDGPGCDCGCVLPPMLARLPSTVSAVVWSATPAPEAPLRVTARRVVPPFRPPAV